jgi:hypothetical protein
MDYQPNHNKESHPPGPITWWLGCGNFDPMGPYFHPFRSGEYTVVRRISYWFSQTGRLAEF